MEELTQEQVEKSVLAAFDSVNLINQLNEKGILTDDETDSLNRNISHLQIMMGKDWFSDALTDEQKTTINSLLV